MAHRVLWITDPWETLDHSQDTTLRLAEESSKCGLKNFWADVHTIRLFNNRVLIDVHQLDGRNVDFSKKVKIVDPCSFDQVHYRTDPPVNLAYTAPLQLLILAQKVNPKCEIVNLPSVLLSNSEKFISCQLPRLSARSLVTSQWREMVEFGSKFKYCVLKPVNEAQSKGVQLIKWDKSEKLNKKNFNTLKKLTHDFSQPILLQEYLKKVFFGEKRFWFANGKLIASVRKKPKAGEFKIDMDRGAFIEKVKLSKKDTNSINEIEHFLKKEKIRLAAVDMIDEKITDFNFTSPGLLVEMEKLLEKNLALAVVKELYES